MNTPRIVDYANPHSFASKLRAKRLGPLIRLIEDARAKYGKAHILDVGGRKTYWNLLPEGFLSPDNTRITILNIAAENREKDDAIFHHLVGNACDMPEFGQGEFHVVHSNSVIEHVGNWPEMKAFAKEVRRVADGLFVQTPHYWFPVEPHYLTPFFHFLPYPSRAWLLQHVQLGNRGKATNLDDALDRLVHQPKLLTRRMFRCLFPDCDLISERFLLMTKSMVAVRPLGATDR